MSVIPQPARDWGAFEVEMKWRTDIVSASALHDALEPLRRRLPRIWIVCGSGKHGGRTARLDELDLLPNDPIVFGVTAGPPFSGTFAPAGGRPINPHPPRDSRHSGLPMRFRPRVTRRAGTLGPSDGGEYRCECGRAYPIHLERLAIAFVKAARAGVTEIVPP